MGLNGILITNLKISVTGTVIMMLVLIAFLPLVLGTSSSPPRTTGNIVATIVVGPEPNEIVYNPSNNKVYVSHAVTGYGSIGKVLRGGSCNHSGVSTVRRYRYTRARLFQ